MVGTEHRCQLLLDVLTEVIAVVWAIILLLSWFYGEILSVTLLSDTGIDVDPSAKRKNLIHF